MPYRVLATIRKNSALSTQAFIDYYENKHVPLIISLSGDTLPSVYKRRYTHRELDIKDSAFGTVIRSAADETVDFDVVVELVFASQAAFATWGARINADGGERIAADEAVFLDRSSMKALVFEEFVTTGGTS